MPDLSRLSEGERACLRLLARGHDTKSLAAELGIGTAAATERLRAARAKLGVTSSREAARLLALAEGLPQETWAMPSGVARSAESGQPEASGQDQLARTGVIAAMTLAALALGAALVLARTEPSLPPEPRVVATAPAQGATIAPGAFTLSVTYDRPMAAQSWSFVRTGRAAYPVCAGRPEQSADGRTFTLRCTAAAGTAYEVAFNSGRFRNFRSVAGVPAQPALLRFKTR